MKREDISIAFGIPHNGDVLYPYLNSIMGLLLNEVSKPKEERVLGSILQSGGCYVDDNRTKLALDLINKTKDTHLMMVDTDIEFQPDIMQKFADLIIEHPEARVIAGRVNLLNGLPVFYNVDHDRKVNVHQSFPFEGIKQFDLVGTGIIVIERELFLELNKKEGHQHFFHRVITGENNIRLGDDFSFCARCWKHDIKIYGAWDIVGLHHKVRIVPQNYAELEQLSIRTK